jgi:folate-binding protein YgfZ
MSDYTALREGAGLWVRDAWRLHRFGGAGRVEFLHKYCTQEVRLEPGRGAYGCVLTVKGATVGDLWVFIRDEDLLMVTAPAAAAGVAKHLGRYALFDTVSLDDVSDDLSLASVWGPKAGAVVADVLGVEIADALAHSTVDWQGGEVVVARNDFADVPGYDLIAARGQSAELHAALAAAGAPQVSEEAVEQVRVEAGTPLFGADLTDSTIPIELGLTERAISFDKGCYMGQEVIARVTHRGRVNRHLRGLRLAADAPVETPAPLHVGSKKVGSLTSCVRSPRVGAVVGLGLVHRKHMEAGTELTLGEGGPVAIVCDLPLR